MNIITLNLAVALMSVTASIAMAQTVSSFSFEPAVLTLEETLAVEQVLNSKAPAALHLRAEETELFSQLLKNGNKTIGFGIVEDGSLGMCSGTNVDAYIIREHNGFSLLYEVETEDDNIARSCSAKISIIPPHAQLADWEIEKVKEKLATATFASEVDSMAFNALLKNNTGSFGLGFSEDDELGSMKVPAESYIEVYIIRSGDGVALYYENFNGTDELLGIRQTSTISLK